MTCRKQTVREALAAAARKKGRKLTKVESRVISTAARKSPIIVCSRSRGSYSGMRYPSVSSIRAVKLRRR